MNDADRLATLREKGEGMVKRYDAGLLSDYGGGNVEWWQDYLCAEIERCNDHWESDYTNLAEENGRLREDNGILQANNKNLRGEISGYKADFGNTEAQTIADLRAKLKQAEDNRDLYFDDLNITKTTLHLAEKALAAQDAELVLAAKVMDTCEETLRHVLNYVEGQGLSAEQDVKESIELIHMFRDAEVVRRLEGERTMNCLGGAVMIKAVCVGGCILFVASLILLLIVTIRRIWRG